MTDYQPIECGLHSQYELWIIQGRTLDLAWTDENGRSRRDRLRPRDLRVSNAEEFLLLEDVQGRQLAVRLDRIRSARPA